MPGGLQALRETGADSASGWRTNPALFRAIPTVAAMGSKPFAVDAMPDAVAPRDVDVTAVKVDADLAVLRLNFRCPQLLVG